MREIFVEIDGKPVKGYAVQKNGVLWAHAKGLTWTVESGVRRSRGAKTSASANPGEITAPMPGKIIKISAPVGSSVAAGDVIIVMEAMKMEYTLKAQAPGRVSEVRVAEGEQIPLGHVLAKLEI